MSPRKPDKLKVIQGSFRKDRANKDAPEYDTEIPPAPDHLGKDALIEWGRISHVLYKQGLLSAVDRAALAAYCDAYGMWVESSEELKRSTFTITTSNGNVIQNPVIGIVNQSREHMRKYLIEFGMTPASRAKVSVKTEKPKDDKWGSLG